MSKLQQIRVRGVQALDIPHQNRSIVRFRNSQSEKIERTLEETIREFCNLAQAEQANDASALYSYERWNQRWPGKNLDELNAEDLLVYFSELSQLNYSMRELERERVLLTTIYAWARRSGLTQSNPVRHVPCFRPQGLGERRRAVRRKEAQFWNEDAQLKLMRACRRASEEEFARRWTPPLYLAPMVRMMLHTGLRLGNILLLEWRHVDLTTQSISLPAQETRLQRQLDIRLSDPATTLLYKLWRSARQTEPRPRWVFRHLDIPVNRLGSIDVGPVYEALRAARLQARIAPGSFETLRRSFAYNRYREGVPFINAATLVDWDDLGFLIKLYQPEAEEH